MKRIHFPVFLLLLVAVTFFSISANAEDAVVKSNCGAEIVEIKATPLQGWLPNTYSKIVLVAESHSETTRLIFDKGAEAFDAACVVGKDQRSYIVFQNYCGGSGCHDLANYGIVDTESLRVLLAPDDSDNNVARAAEILGNPAPQLLTYQGKFFPPTAPGAPAERKLHLKAKRAPLP